MSVCCLNCCCQWWWWCVCVCVCVHVCVCVCVFATFSWRGLQFHKTAEVEWCWWVLMDFHVLARAVCSDIGSCLCRGGSSLVERAGPMKGRMAGMPKVSVSPDFKRPPFNPTLYASPSSNSRGEANPRQTPVRRSRKSLREIKPHLEESACHSKASDVRGVGGQLCIWVYSVCSEGVDEHIINVQYFSIIIIMYIVIIFPAALLSCFVIWKFFPRWHQFCFLWESKIWEKVAATEVWKWGVAP